MGSILCKLYAIVLMYFYFHLELACFLDFFKLNRSFQGILAIFQL